MDEFATKLRKVVRDYPDVLSDKKRLKALLNDTFPTEGKEVNLLSLGFDVGVADLVALSEDEAKMRGVLLQKRLNTEFGITMTNAEW